MNATITNVSWTWLHINSWCDVDGDDNDNGNEAYDDDDCGGDEHNDHYNDDDCDDCDDDDDDDDESFGSTATGSTARVPVSGRYRHASRRYRHEGHHP